MGLIGWPNIVVKEAVTREETQVPGQGAHEEMDYNCELANPIRMIKKSDVWKYIGPDRFFLLLQHFRVQSKTVKND